MAKRIKQIQTEINKIVKNLLEKYPELENISMDCCYGYDAIENPLNVHTFKMQETQ